MSARGADNVCNGRSRIGICRRNRPGGCAHRAAFTLVELLIVVAVIAILISILLPALRSARQQAKIVVCSANLRQIASANIGYSTENGGRFCPGAADSLMDLNRWHGTRKSTTDPFEPKGGPLVAYLGEQEGIRACPSFRPVDGAAIAPERGSGAYGYNQSFLGCELSQVTVDTYKIVTDRLGAIAERVDRPAKTIMFTDAALAASVDGPVEYSFAEPRFFAVSHTFRHEPSIHFRHRKTANVAWADSHVDRQKRTFTYRSGLYPGDPKRLGIGWFGEEDSNALFDLH